ncbi:MAG TPA: beta-galactosidase [Candidatus Baltobacteraceae bacterium]|nr:beta-galactosidase [Candidatus Baltobacteraceae bacterium]
MGTFLLGVNYWPRRSAMYMWERFDLGEIREDFARIRALGLHVVRFFISWDDFEPQAGTMDAKMLRRFDAVMDAAAGAAIQTMPTFFTGHMSGVNYLPAWVLDRSKPHGRFRTFARGMQQLPWAAGNFYEGELLAYCHKHVRAIGERAHDHPALYCWDLGNEFSNLRSADSPQAAAGYSRTLAHELERASGKGTCAGTHGEDLTQDRGIRPSSFCEPLLFAVMHGYSVYSSFARSRTDPEVVPFLCQLMQSMSGKPVLFNEFGNPTCPPGTVSPYDRVPLPGDPPVEAAHLPKNAAPFACLTEDEMATYCYEVLDRLQRRGALGAFWWNWADYDERLWNTPPFDQAPHELTFGMIRSDGSDKAVARTLQRFAREGRSAVSPPPPIVAEDEWYKHMDKASHSAAYQQYLAMYASDHARP